MERVEAREIIRNQPKGLPDAALVALDDLIELIDAASVIVIAINEHDIMPTTARGLAALAQLVQTLRGLEVYLECTEWVGDERDTEARDAFRAATAAAADDEEFDMEAGLRELKEALLGAGSEGRE
jgi:hypothetical protein